MRILLVNLHSSRNAGDAVLTDVSVQQLQIAFPGAALILAMNDPASYAGPGVAMGSFMHWLKKGRSWRWRAWPSFFLAPLLALVTYRWRGRPLLSFASKERLDLLKAYFEADLVVSCPGNFLYSSGRLGLPFLISVFTMAYALWARKPLYMLPQTVGPLRRQWERRAVRWVTGRMRLVFVRDRLSKELSESTGLAGERCHLAPDLAFLYQAAEQSQGESLLATYGLEPAQQRPLLGITVLDWAAQSRLFTRQADYEAAVAGLIGHFVRHYQGWVVLFSQVQGPTAAEDDRRTAARLYRALGSLEGRLVYIEQAVSPAVLRAAYSLMDLFVGTRLHSNIFALSEGVPVLAIQYQYKTRGVLETVGLAEWVQPIDEVNEATLITHFDRLWQQQEQLRQQLREVMPEVVAQAAAVGPQIAADFARR